MIQELRRRGNWVQRVFGRRSMDIEATWKTKNPEQVDMSVRVGRW